jgi:hypothetical protein
LPRVTGKRPLRKIKRSSHNPPGIRFQTPGAWGLGQSLSTRMSPRPCQSESFPAQEAAALGARLRELRWKNNAWLATADTIAG